MMRRWALRLGPFVLGAASAYVAPDWRTIAAIVLFFAALHIGEEA